MRSCKLKFDCTRCRKTWSSMKGSLEIVLWNQSKICCQMYSQECSRCRTFGTPTVYSEEFQTLILHVIDKYEEAPQPKNIHKTEGQPRTPHKSNLCEACKLGRCSVNSEQIKD
jgi:hypothetical protein